MIEFVCWVVVVALVAAFLLGLAQKWGLLEWLQVHAPNDWLHELFTCKFCCSWWVSLAISIVAAFAAMNATLFLVPFCSTVIARELW